MRAARFLCSLSSRLVFGRRSQVNALFRLRRGVTLVEALVGLSLMGIVFGFLLSSVMWVRSSFRLLGQAEQYTRLGYLYSNFVKELTYAREVQLPLKVGRHYQPAQRLMFYDRHGDLNLIFLDEKKILTQYNMGKQQFRDIQLEVSRFEVKRPAMDRVEVTIELSIEKETFFVRHDIRLRNFYHYYED